MCEDLQLICVEIINVVVMTDQVAALPLQINACFFQNDPHPFKVIFCV